MFIAAGQLRRLQSLLAHARETVPFYADAGHGLGEFPVVSKALLRAKLEGFISKQAGCDRTRLISFLRREHPQEGDELPFDQDISVELTSGSSGLPFCVPRTRAERVVSSINLWRYRRTIDPRASPATFFAMVHRPRNQALPGSSLELAEILTKHSMRWIHASPSFLVRWANHLTNAAQSPPATLRYAESTGAYLGSAEREIIGNTLGVKVVDQYGCRELSAIAYSLGDGFFQPLRDNVVVEILDESESPITTVGRIGRVVVTSLHQRLMPFIRYDSGDLAVLAQNQAGDHGLVLCEGRPHELIHGSRRRHGTQVFKGIMAAVNRELGLVELSYLQIRQMSERVFLIVCSQSLHAEAVRESISRHFNRHCDALPFPTEFRVEQLPQSSQPKNIMEKECLFTNIYYVPEANNSPGCVQ